MRKGVAASIIVLLLVVGASIVLVSRDSETGESIGAGVLRRISEISPQPLPTPTPIEPTPPPEEEPTPPAEEPTTCFDSDGDDIFTRGICIYGTIIPLGSGKSDFCIDSRTVNEYTCSNNVCVGNAISCPNDYYCTDGACTKPTVECTDSDDGLNYYVEGTAADATTSRADSCDPQEVSLRLFEYYCDGNLVESTEYTCEYGCDSGACLGTGELLPCSDSDGGIDYHTKGKVTTDGFSQEDSCSDLQPDSLYEWYCENSVFKFKSYTCPNGCKDGACLSIEPVCEDNSVGTATATSSVNFGDYRIFSDIGSHNTWARIIVEDTTGTEVEKLTIDDPDRVGGTSIKDTSVSGLRIQVFDIDADHPDGTVDKTYLAVNSIDCFQHTPICRDTDDGKDYLVKGTCSGSQGSATDRCLPNGDLQEYSCNLEKGSCESFGGSCETLVGSGYVCKEGECVSETQGESCYSSYWDIWIKDDETCCNQIACSDHPKRIKDGVDLCTLCPRDALDSWICQDGTFVPLDLDYSATCEGKSVGDACNGNVCSSACQCVSSACNINIDCRATDTDGGMNVFEKGTCTGKECSNGACVDKADKTDSCKDSVYIYEYSPASGNARNVCVGPSQRSCEIECQAKGYNTGVCSDGACVCESTKGEACYSSYWDRWIQDGETCCNQIACSDHPKRIKDGIDLCTFCPTDVLDGWVCQDGKFVSLDLSYDATCEGKSVGDSCGTGTCTATCQCLTDETVNNPPTLASISASPSVASLGNYIKVSSDASDPDGDSIRLGCGSSPGSTDLCEGPPTTSDPTCSFSSPWEDDRFHTVYCRAHDGNLYSDIKTNSIIADNTEPAASISYSPKSPTASDTVTYVVEASDDASGLKDIKIYVDGALKKTCDFTGPDRVLLTHCYYVEGPYALGSTHTHYSTVEDNIGFTNRDPTTGSKSFTVVSGCVRDNPLILISPDIQEGKADSELTYTVTVSNQDNSDCGDSTFSLTGKVPSGGWGYYFEPSSLTLSPGAEKDSNYNVKSYSEANPDDYAITATTTNDADGSFSSSDSAVYRVVEELSFPSCTLTANPSSSVGPFSSVLTATFSNLPSDISTAKVKCSAADAEVSVDILDNIASRTCDYPAVTSTANYFASASAADASCEKTITVSPPLEEGNIEITSFTCEYIGSLTAQCNLEVKNLGTNKKYYLLVAGGGKENIKPAIGATTITGGEEKFTVVVLTLVGDTYQLGAWLFEGTNPDIIRSALTFWTGDPVEVKIFE